MARVPAADAVVIGGGIIGMSIAWRLAQSHLRVVVLDAGRIGGEASWAGAGMLAPGGEIAERSDLAEMAIESLRMYPGFVDELRAETGAAIDYRACGAIELASAEHEWKALMARAASQRKLGIQSVVLETGRLFYRDDAIVDPREVVHALRLACEARGVMIREGEAAAAIRVQSGSIIEPWPAAFAVLAAGAWSGSIPVYFNGSRLLITPTRPVRGHLVSYALEPGSLPTILRHGHTYVLQRSNGLTIAGSTTEEAGFDRTVDDGIVREIEQRAAALLPRLASTPRADAWIGFRPATETGEVRIGRLDDAPVFLAYGHYRNGILLAPVTARQISRAVIQHTISI